MRPYVNKFNGVQDQSITYYSERFVSETKISSCYWSTMLHIHTSKATTSSPTECWLLMPSLPSTVYLSHDRMTEYCSYSYIISFFLLNTKNNHTTFCVTEVKTPFGMSAHKGIISLQSGQITRT